MSVVRMMISAADIQAKVKQLGHQINAHYAQSDKELVLIGILRGSVIFMADLCRTIEKPHQLDFMTVSSYGSSTVSSRDVKILKDLDGEIYDKDVLLVEDIIDTGHSLSKVIEMLQTRQPHSIELCSLVSKPSRREIDLEVKFLGYDDRKKMRLSRKALLPRPPKPEGKPRQERPVQSEGQEPNADFKPLNETENSPENPQA